MSKADDGLRKELHKFLPRHIWNWSVIETGGTIAGVPDSHFVHADTRRSGWVESKATTGWAVEVRPQQVSWIVPRVAAGERVTVAVRARGVGSAAGAGDSLWLVQGGAIRELQEFGLQLPTQFVLGKWFGPPKTWDWKEIARLITI